MAEDRHLEGPVTGGDVMHRFSASWTPRKAALSQRTLEVLATDESQASVLHEKNAAAALADLLRLLAQEVDVHMAPFRRWMYEWQALMQRNAPAS
ncbi:hypothetical protein WJX72_008390 [[Myrmecia] bisecta]|uniref:Uncharacterized protein n=1 Tax=[Myrmecia] bisecta TaxID=41462 RepID=A0AAW1Q2M7_9CHLO